VEIALRIYNEDNSLLKNITTRTGLVVDDNLEVKNDLSEFTGKKYVLFSITEQEEIASGTIE
jgi:hypothetical protein